MPLVYFLPVIFLYIFGLINLLGIRPDLVFSYLIFFAVGAIIFSAIKYLQVHRHFFRQNSVLFYWICIALLFLTLFFGSNIKGSRRWLDLYFFQIQMSEIFKVFFIVFLAKYFSAIRSPIENSKVFLKTFIFALIPFILIFRQPDLAGALIVMVIYFVMLFHSSATKKQILIFFAIAVILLPASWFFLADYQKNRVLSFVNPEIHSAGASYNMIQAKIAIGSGQIFGEGLGLGKQSRLYFLPEYHTDFAYSSLVEQFGFVGGAIVIFLYVIFISLLFISIGQNMDSTDVENRYRFFYLLGFSVFLMIQTSINIGMNLGIMPIAGITLPFISYGGSSLITFLVALALIP